MEPMGESPTDFTRFVADEFARRGEALAREWVEELSSRLGVRPRRVLPTESLVDHMPEVIGRISMHLRAGNDPIETEPVVTDELASLARLRRQQGYDIEELLREFRILGRILDDLVVECVEMYGEPPDPRSVALVAGWLHRSLQVLGMVTASIFREEEMKERTASGRLLRDFADTMVHQIKTPLGAAEGAALLLENEEMAADPEERARFAEIVRRNLQRARTVVDDVRKLALAESSYGKVGRMLPLGEVLSEVREELREIAKARGVEVRVEEPPPELAVDASRTEIVLLNLIGNGIRYSDPGKPGRWVRVGFAPAEEPGGWWVQVRDNGLGIPEELHGRIFQRFFRAHPEVAEGTGLGLSIVKEAIAQMGSRLEFESEPGVGTTFRFLLPRPEEER